MCPCPCPGPTGHCLSEDTDAEQGGELEDACGCMLSSSGRVWGILGPIWQG